MSTKSLARANSKKNIQLEDLEAVPQCLSYKFIGDPVDGIPFKQTEYAKEARVCKVPISRETSKSNLGDSAEDAGDTAAASSIPDPKDLEIGFNLISLTSRRGHFVDKVRPNSKADEAGLKHGDLLLEVNGVMVRDFSHEDLVSFIRQTSVEAFNLPAEEFDGLKFKVVASENPEKKTEGD